MKQLIKRLVFSVYQVPFNHGLQEIFWHYKNKLKNLMTRGTFDFFYKVELETITECNRRCKYCPNFVYPKKKKLMRFEVFKKIIDDLAKINYSNIIAPHLYGEPLLDKRLPKFIIYAKKKLPKAQILIYTNGDYLDKPAFLNFIECGADKFFVTQHENKPPKTFIRWYKNASFADKKRIIFQRMNKNSLLSNRGGLVKVKNKKHFKRCFLPKSYLVIDVDGNVLLCCNDFFGKHKFGNMMKKSINDIWNNRKYKKYRDEINKGDYSLEMCKKCSS